MRLYKEAIDEGASGRALHFNLCCAAHPQTLSEGALTFCENPKAPHGRQTSSLSARMWTTPPAYTRWASCKRELSLSASTPSNPAGLVKRRATFTWRRATTKGAGLQHRGVRLRRRDSITLTTWPRPITAWQRQGQGPRIFPKAIELKPTQIDTLYFLAQHDIEEGNKTRRGEAEKALKGRFSPSTMPRAKWCRPR